MKPSIPSQELETTSLQPRKKMGGISRQLWGIKQGLRKVRNLIDVLQDLESRDFTRFVKATGKMRKLLQPYRRYVENPSPDTYAKFCREEGFFSRFFPFFFESLPAEDPFRCYSFMSSALSERLTLDMCPVSILRTVERKYCSLYLEVRAWVLEELRKNNANGWGVALTILGPRVEADHPLSRDPLLLQKEELWLTNGAGIPQAQRQEAQRQLRMIGDALSRVGAGPPLLEETERPLSKREAVARSSAVALRLRRYKAFRKEGKTQAEALSLIEQELEENRRISPKRKSLILLSLRKKVEQIERSQSEA